MSIISFEGVQGMGKTTAAVALAVEESKRLDRRVISNVHINHPNFQHFDIAWFLEHIADHEIEDALLVLDEMYQLADNRTTQSKLNKLFSYFIVQCRKRNVDLYVCTHNILHIDIKLRRAIDIRGSCRYYPEKPCKKCRCKVCGGSGMRGSNGQLCEACKGVGGTGRYGSGPCDRCLGYGESGWVKVYFLDRRAKKRYTLELFGPEHWHLFNTRERIPMQARLVQGIDAEEIGAVL